MFVRFLRSANSDSIHEPALCIRTNNPKALTPFHSSNSSTPYTSASARSTRSFGYTYPEVVDWNANATELSSSVRAALNKLYNPTGSISTRSLPQKGPLTARNSSYESALSYPNATMGNYQYFVNIRVDKYVLFPFPAIPLYISTPPKHTPTQTAPS